jgi:hypothetical protein
MCLRRFLTKNPEARSIEIDSRLKREFSTPRLVHVYEVRPRKDHRGIDLISDVLPSGHRKNVCDSFRFLVRI